MVGAKEIATLIKKKSNTRLKHAADTAAKLTAPFFRVMSNINIKLNPILHYVPSK